MRRCLELAATAAGYAAPNPMVGAVIVYRGQIIGEGYHRRYGTPHAEVNAIQAVRNPQLLNDATLYVNLEPCAHYGKTPPCAELIIKKRIPRVVVGSGDPNPLVAGKGIAMLRAAGCTVTQHVLEDECSRLNIRFMTYQRLKRPYIILKWAQTADGMIAPPRSSRTAGRPTWITGAYEQMLVHRWRSEEQAVMVGTNTAEDDNPLLNVRKWGGRQPLRVTLDRTLRLPASLNLMDGTLPALVLTEKEATDLPNLSYATIPFDSRLPQHVADELFGRNVTSVLIEGGTQLLQAFADCGLWDEMRIFTGASRFGRGIQAPTLPPIPTGIFKIYDKETTCGKSRLRIIRKDSV